MVVKVRGPGAWVRSRAYSVSSNPAARGEFTLVVKVYDGGWISGYLNAIEIGKAVHFAGTLITKRLNPAARAATSTVILVAFGIGISEVLPLASYYLSIADASASAAAGAGAGAAAAGVGAAAAAAAAAVLQDTVLVQDQKPRVTVLYAAKKTEDLVLLHELGELETAYGRSIFKLRFVLSRDPDASKPLADPCGEWAHGRIGPKLLGEYFDERYRNNNNVFYKVVGTKEMMKSTAKHFSALGIRGRI